MRCESLSDRLTDVAAGAATLDAASQAHVDRCLRCQAELAQYRRMLRVMRTMRSELLPPAPGLLADIFEALETAGERHALRLAWTGRRVAYVGGLAATAAAAGAGAALLHNRSRRVRFPSLG
jgi:hypothetical protein